MAFTIQDLEDAINGYRTFTRGKGSPVIPLRLTKAEKARYTQFTEQGFAIQEGRRNLFAAFSHWCEVHKKPQIYARKKAKYAHVELDMILTGHELTGEAVELVRQVLHRHSVFRNPKYPNDDARAGAVYSFSNRIPKGKAEQVALELAQIAFNTDNWKKV